MKKFFKDYWALTKETGRFYKEHWLGTIVLTAVCTGLEVGYFHVRMKKAEKECLECSQKVVKQFSEEEEA